MKKHDPNLLLTLLLAVLGLAVLFTGPSLFEQMISRNETPGTSTLEAGPAEPEGEFCGGIAGDQCPKGYGCKLDGSYPDASGVCVKK